MVAAVARGGRSLLQISNTWALGATVSPTLCWNSRPKGLARKAVGKTFLSEEAQVYFIIIFDEFLFKNCPGGGSKARDGALVKGPIVLHSARSMSSTNL